jgi:vitamin B12 transporter
MKQILITVALFGAIFLPFIAYAETPMELVIVTPTRMPQQLNKIISDTTLITEQDIRNSGAADVASLLEQVAGVEIYQGGGVGKQSSLFLRGSNSSHVLVLLDGVRINSATAGTTQVDQLMLDQIERIEVVRGNVSSLYGSDAIGGVIQIFTKRGKGVPAFNVGAGAGTHNTQRVSAGYGGEAANTTYNVQVSKFRTDGISAVKSSLVPTVNPDRDGYDNTSVSANLRYDWAEAHSLSASLFNSSGHNQTDNPYGSITDVNSSKSHIRKFALVSENRINDSWQSKVQLSRGVDDSQNFLNGVPDVAMGAQFKTSSDQLLWQNTLSVGENNLLIVGLEKLKQRVVSSTLYSRTKRTDDSLFAGYTGNYDAHQVQVNFRRDQYADSGAANTWLLGYGYELSDAWRVTASTATAFKTPTLNDLYYPFVDYGTFGGVSYSYQGNPNLKPERSRDSEFGLHFTGEGQYLDAVYFNNRIRDLIVITTQPAATMTNLDAARNDGVELVYKGLFGDTSVRLAITRQDPRDADTSQPLLRRANNFSSAGVTRRLGMLKVGGEWQHSGARTDVDINTFARVTLAAYDVANLTANYSMDEHFELTARVDNIFNRDYMLAHGYNSPGRTLFVGLNYQQ